MTSATSGMPDLQGRRLLVVEDEELIGLMLVDLLEEMGAQVVGPAATAAEALELATSERLSGALLDLSLGGAPAYPIADRLMERDIPFVFITGYGQAHILPRYAHVPVLTKPFGQRHLTMLLAGFGRVEEGGGAAP